MRFVKVPGHNPDISETISVKRLKELLEEFGIEYLITIPESNYEVLLEDIASNSKIKLVQVCRESEGIAVCSGLSYGGRITSMICTFKGLYNSVDSLLGTAIRTQSSFLLLISESSGQAKRLKSDLEEGVFTAEILNSIKMPFYEVWNNTDLSLIKEAWEKTKISTKPVAVILRW